MSPRVQAGGYMLLTHTWNSHLQTWFARFRAGEILAASRCQAFAAWVFSSSTQPWCWCTHMMAAYFGVLIGWHARDTKTKMLLCLSVGCVWNIHTLLHAVQLRRSRERRRVPGDACRCCSFHCDFHHMFPSRGAAVSMLMCTHILCV